MQCVHMLNVVTSGRVYVQSCCYGWNLFLYINECIFLYLYAYTVGEQVFFFGGGWMSLCV